MTSKAPNKEAVTEDDAPPAARYYEALWHAAGDVAGEAALFARSRFDKDADFSRRLSACSNPVEAMGLHQSWVAQATQDYMRECARMSKIVFRSNSYPDA